MVSPLRGRDDAIAVIDGALSDARNGRGAVILVEGGAGLGKTRLLAEAESLAESAGVRAWGERTARAALFQWLR
jgi:hypothetical protein